jgi:hypothetical protein
VAAGNGTRMKSIERIKADLKMELNQIRVNQLNQYDYRSRYLGND